MKKSYTIDDCMKDIITARDIIELLCCTVSQEEGRKTIVLTSDALSGLESILKMSKKSLTRAIQYIDMVSTGELKRMVQPLRSNI